MDKHTKIQLGAYGDEARALLARATVDSSRLRGAQLLMEADGQVVLGVRNRDLSADCMKRALSRRLRLAAKNLHPDDVKNWKASLECLADLVEAAESEQTLAKKHGKLYEKFRVLGRLDPLAAEAVKRMEEEIAETKLDCQTEVSRFTIEAWSRCQARVAELQKQIQRLKDKAAVYSGQLSADVCYDGISN